MPDFITQHLKKSVGDKLLFSDLRFIIHPLDRIGLLGLNGAGKTTLLDIIEGRVGFDGDMSPFDAPSNFKINYLSQEPSFDPNETILDSVLDDSLPQAKSVKAYEKALSDLIEEPGNEALQTKLSQAEIEITQLDAWNIEAEVKSILTQLGVPNFSRKIGSLSGGQKRRVQLAQALVNPSDLLLLDEPTNHLDVEIINWLQNYLTSSKKTLLFVTHDRYFLDQVATRIFELENSGLQEYKGNYQDYLEQKAIREEQNSASLHKAELLYKSELTWIRKSPQARSTKQQARIDRFDYLADSLKTDKALGEMQINISSQRLGKKVIEFENAGFSFPNRHLFQNFNLIVQANSRIGIVGDNGVGKSTLLNIINNELVLDSGKIDIGETVRIGYFSQEIRGISPQDEDKRIINFLEEVASASHTNDGQSISVVDLLEQFLFPRSRHGELIRKLSGGEKKRLYLLKILLLRPNVLLLDEPTNDLDVTTLTVLEKFLQSFPGAVLTVSHDRYFQDKVSNELLAFENGQIQHYIGSYTDYLSTKSDSTAEKKLKTQGKKEEAPRKIEKVHMTYHEKHEWETVEDEISQLEIEISAVETEMNQSGSDFGKLNELQKILDDKNLELSNKYERWEYLSERV
ncbi:ABC-F family ATP-binding cassette domain-containing protein [Lactovum miscens]|nr:ABC-F family ATP-binding cassette domain-containing protein [Lactovum miscens]